MIRLRLLLCILLAWWPGRMGLAAEPMPEYAMKAAYLYNFALFTEWPLPPDAPLNLCILGKDQFGAALDSLDGKAVNGQRLEVSRVSGKDGVRHCQILYLGDLDGVNIHRILLEIEDTPILTVADNEELMPAGVMIGLSIQDKRLTFDVNPDAARRAHLAISSKLLRLARKIY